MGFPQLRHYVNDEAQSSDDATWKKSLPNRGALYTLFLKVTATNGATDGHGVNILDVVDEISIKGDGSTVIYSVYPEELEKWIESLTGTALPALNDEQASANQWMVFPIMFGRYVYDEEYYLDLSRFRDVAIEVKYSPPIAASGGFASGSVKFDLMLMMNTDAPAANYKGTLVTRRIRSYTSSNSGEEEVELPDNSVIRAIGNYVYAAGVDDGDSVTTVKVEDKATGSVIFEADWDDFLVFNRSNFGADIRHEVTAFVADNDTIKTRLGDIRSIAISALVGADVSADTFVVDNVDDIAGDTLTVSSALADITEGAASLTSYGTKHACLVKVTGNSPSYFGIVPFGYNDTGSDWLNTAKFGKLFVNHKQGASGAAVYLSIQELRRF